MKQPEPDLFRAMRPPSLPQRLEHRVLSRARSSVGHHRSPIDRLWESHRLRWAWAAAMVLLLGVQLRLAAPMVPPDTGTVDPQRVGSVSEAAPELVPFLARHPIRESSGTRPLDASRRLEPFTAIDPLS